MARFYFFHPGLLCPMCQFPQFAHRYGTGAPRPFPRLILASAARAWFLVRNCSFHWQSFRCSHFILPICQGRMIPLSVFFSVCAWIAWIKS